MRINHNIAALNTNRALSANNIATSKALEKLSSGLAINRAGDNAAGLAISEKMRGQIRGLDQATDNANDGISLIQTAEGGLNETHSILDRMRELAVQSANDTNTASDRATIQKEIDQLAKEVTRISKDTEFNTQPLLSGKMNAKITSTLSNPAGVAYGPEINNVDKIDLTETYTGTATVIHVGDSIAESGDTKINTSAFSQSSTIPKGTYEFKPTGVDSLLNTMNAVLYKDGAVCTNPSVAISVSNYSSSSSNGLTDPALDGLTLDLQTTTEYSEGQSLGTFTVSKADKEINKIGWVDSSNNPVPKKIADEAFYVRLSNKAATGDTIKISDIKDVRMAFHIGANAGQYVRFGAPDTSAKALGVDNLDLTQRDTADSAITVIDHAIDRVSSVRASFGAMQNRLEHTINNLGTSQENLTAAESQIRDVDMAEEMSGFTKNNILVQAATSMLAQANQMPQSVLTLLQG